MAEFLAYRKNRVVVLDPSPPKIVQVLRAELTYNRKVFLQGRELYEARRAKRSLIREVEQHCYTTDHRNRIGFAFGLLPRVSRRLKELGHTVRLIDYTAYPDVSVFNPQWDALDEHFKLRYRQRECLEIFANRKNGCFDAPPGFGKSTQMQMLALLFPRARIDIVTKRADVARNLYDGIGKVVHTVGLVGAGRNDLSSRVRVFVGASLHKTDGNADFLIGDECHELAADMFIPGLMMYDRARCFGMTATLDMRADNMDMRVESIFGPRRFKMSYQEAQRKNLVVPIRVYWRDVVMDNDPCAGMAGVPKERHGIWRNTYRNRLIAEDARRYDENTQVLIMVKTVEHAVYLKKLLPEFTLVYAEAGMHANDRHSYISRGLIADSEPLMTRERRAKLRKRFERGKLRKVIATSVWSTGVDFKSLSVLIRADGCATAIMDTQIPGRVSRIDDKTRKRYAVLHDYRDIFNTGLLGRSRKRASNYRGNGWQEFETGKVTRQKSLFGDEG